MGPFIFGQPSDCTPPDMGLGFHYLGLGLGTIWGDPPKYQLFGVEHHCNCISLMLQYSVFGYGQVFGLLFGYLGLGIWVGIWGAHPNTNYLGGDPKYPNTILVCYIGGGDHMERGGKGKAYNVMWHVKQ